MSRFADLCRSHLHFLTEVFGFQPPEAADTEGGEMVRFFSERVFVVMTFGAPDFEVKLGFGIRDIDETCPVELGDLAHDGRLDDWKWRNEFADAMENTIVEFARVLRERGSDLLVGDESTYERFRARRNQMSRNWLQHEEDCSVRAQAVDAWQKKDFDRVKKLYESLSDRLSAIETKRLEIAKSRLK